MQISADKVIEKKSNTGHMNMNTSTNGRQTDPSLNNGRQIDPKCHKCKVYYYKLTDPGISIEPCSLYHLWLTKRFWTKYRTSEQVFINSSREIIIHSEISIDQNNLVLVFINSSRKILILD